MDWIDNDELNGYDVLSISTASIYPMMTHQFDTYFLESDDITGPWSYVTYMCARQTVSASWPCTHDSFGKKSGEMNG